ncbi:hypothetical protein, conserved [Eimeria tenella]|uniref:Transmembrane protein n=1 Tax=Eimeria tenella TaxID=5802 RepID=U6L103_EIMTE|nr:hypothetical protein, conserved [Eimeria tenella]CDJ42878.1 hypothetical protein, conserved [Eimeria tenella]|eukprot:XP_013233628.1 hypothetical protein, conserved [Eimeria tenella]
MSRASIPPASFISPPTRHDFGDISVFLQLTQHGGALHSSSGVSRSRPRSVGVAFHKARVVLLSVLAAIAITLGCFRAFYGWAGNRAALRQLAASFPGTNEDPELSAILDMCLDMEEERGSSNQVGMFSPQQGHVPSPGIPPASRLHQRPLQEWDVPEQAQWLTNTVKVADDGPAVEGLQYSLTISMSEAPEGSFSTAGTHTQSHVPSWAGSSASSFDVALKSSVDLAKDAHAGEDTALDTSSRVIFEAHSEAEQHPSFGVTQPISDYAHQALANTGSSRKRRFDEADLSDLQSPVAHQEGVEERKERGNAPAPHGEVLEVTKESSGFGGPLRDIAPGELLKSVVFGSYDVQGDKRAGRSALRGTDCGENNTGVSSDRRPSEGTDSESEDSEAVFARHPFYKLPKLAPFLETNLFCEDSAFSRGCLSGHTSLLLMSIRSVFKAEWVTEAKARKLAWDVERLVCNLYYLQREPVSHYIVSRAVIFLGQRFLLLDALVSALSVLSPVVNASAWWSKLVTVIPSEVPFNSGHTSFERTRQYEDLANRLIRAIDCLKNGTRLGAKETVELKRDLLCRELSPPWFRKGRWKYWRMDDEIELNSSKKLSCGRPAPTRVSDSSWSQ